MHRELLQPVSDPDYGNDVDRRLEPFIGEQVVATILIDSTFSLLRPSSVPTISTAWPTCGATSVASASNRYSASKERLTTGVDPFALVVPANPDALELPGPPFTGVEPLDVYVRPAVRAVVGALGAGIEAFEELVPALPRCVSTLRTAFARMKRASVGFAPALATGATQPINVSRLATVELPGEPEAACNGTQPSSPTVVMIGTKKRTSTFHPLLTRW
jgi:hypothetical protein